MALINISQFHVIHIFLNSIFWISVSAILCRKYMKKNEHSHTSTRHSLPQFSASNIQTHNMTHSIQHSHFTHKVLNAEKRRLIHHIYTDKCPVPATQPCWLTAVYLLKSKCRETQSHTPHPHRQVSSHCYTPMLTHSKLGNSLGDPQSLLVKLTHSISNTNQA